MARWALIADHHSATRARCAREIAARLRERGVAVGGFVQQRCPDASEREGFELVRLSASEERVKLASHGAASSAADDLSCDYVFAESAFERSRKWIEEDATRCGVLFLDVISKMESYGEGHAQALRYALGLAESKVVVVCARSSRLIPIFEEFRLDVDTIVSWLELPVSEADKGRFVRELLATPPA